MAPADLPQARRVEHAAYGHANPRTPFERELGNGLAQYLVIVEPRQDRAPSAAAPGGPFAALRRWLSRPPAEAVCGFAGVWFTVDQLHLVTIAVEPGWQVRGLATRLLLRCFDLARDAQLASVALEVRASNMRAQRLYQRFGFTPAGTLRGYYVDNGEDALVMLSGPLDSPVERARIEAIRRELGGGDGIGGDVVGGPMGSAADGAANPAVDGAPAPVAR